MCVRKCARLLTINLMSCVWRLCVPICRQAHTGKQTQYTATRNNLRGAQHQASAKVPSPKLILYDCLNQVAASTGVHVAEQRQKGKTRVFETHNGGDGKTVENHVEGLPQLQTVPALALIVEPASMANTPIARGKHQHLLRAPHHRGACHVRGGYYASRATPLSSLMHPVLTLAPHFPESCVSPAK